MRAQRAEHFRHSGLAAAEPAGESCSQHGQALRAALDTLCWMQGAERVREILEMVVCPACHGRLDLNSTSATVETVRCIECGKSYPIVDGIPVLLVSRAHSGSGPDLNDESTEK